jgi:hypothetical protein
LAAAEHLEQLLAELVLSQTSLPVLSLRICCTLTSAGYTANQLTSNWIFAGWLHGRGCIALQVLAQLERRAGIQQGFHSRAGKHPIVDRDES